VIATIVADNSQLPIVIGGDFNLEFRDGSTRCYAVNYLMTSANLFRCSTTEATTRTFCCVSKNAASLIDHVSRTLSGKVYMCYTIDSGFNFSDHLSLVLGCQLPASPLSACQSSHGTKGQAPVQKPKRYRWDKADLMSYYFTTDHYLSSVGMTAITKMNYCPVGCHFEISRFIDTTYQNIVQLLHSATRDHCPLTTGSFFKSYWDEEMSELKQRTIATHQLL